MKSELASFVIFIVDAAICAFLFMAIYSMVKKRAYMMGRWYSLYQNKSEFLQVVFGYFLLALVLAYFRIFDFPEKLFPYL